MPPGPRLLNVRKERKTMTEDERLVLSDLLDGRLQGQALEQAVRLACASESAREHWHAWHLAGDVLRAGELAQAHARLGPDFAAALMARVQQTPQEAAPPAPQVVQIAQPVPAANDARWRWVAGLASFAAVAVLGLSLWGRAGDPQGGAQWAGTQTPAQASAQAPVQASVLTPDPAWQAAYSAAPQGAMLRDAHLDELLAAHRQAADAAALGSTQGFLRNATFSDTMPAPARP